MRAWFACTGAELLALTPDGIAGALAASQMSRRLSGEPTQLTAWRAEVALLQRCVREAGGQGWAIALEYDLLRLEKRIDAVVLMPGAIVVLEFKVGATAIANADCAQVSDYAQDLFDFHAGSRRHPIQPIVVATRHPAPAPFQMPLPVAGVLPVAQANEETLAPLLGLLARTLSGHGDPLGMEWCDAPYRPVPSIVEAAATLFARNSVAEIAAARADAANLTTTTAAIERALDQARQRGERVVVFVTGIPFHV